MKMTLNSLLITLVNFYLTKSNNNILKSLGFKIFIPLYFFRIRRSESPVTR